MPEAAAYSETPGLHPLVYFDPEKDSSSQSQIPVAWMPATAQELQLVLCVRPSEANKVEFCTYLGSMGITRYQYSRWLTLRSAQTGEEIDSRLFRGTAPPTCPYSKSGTDSEDLYGSLPDAESESVRDWLRPYIIQNPPAGG